MLLPALAARCWRCCTAVLCSLPRVSDIATGIALMLLGTGLAFYLGKPLIQPQAAQIPAIDARRVERVPQVQSALPINALFPVGVVLAALMHWGFAQHALGPDRAHGGRLERRGAGRWATRSTACASRHHGRRLHRRHRRRLAVAVLSGQLERRPVQRPGPDRGGAGDLRALAVRCAACGAALLFGGAGAIGPALQSVGISGGYYLFSAVPYVLTLAILIATSSARARAARRARASSALAR